MAGHGPTDAVLRVASVSKLVTTYACSWRSRRAPSTSTSSPGRGATVRHLLAHAGATASTAARSSPWAPRIYSNTGIELADHLAHRAGMAAAAYVNEAVLTPLA